MTVCTYTYMYSLCLSVSSFIAASKSFLILLAFIFSLKLLKGQRKSRKYEAIVHQAQVKLSPKPLSNPDTDLNPNWEAHKYH